MSYLYDVGYWYYHDNFGGRRVWFVGSTFATVRALLPVINNRLEIDFAFGLGMLYSDGDKNRSGSGSRIALFTNKDGDLVPIFAIKSAAGMIFYVNDNFGIGINFDYNVGFHSVDKGYLGHSQYDYEMLFHQMSPGLHVRAQF